QAAAKISRRRICSWRAITGLKSVGRQSGRRGPRAALLARGGKYELRAKDRRRAVDFAEVCERKLEAIGHAKVSFRLVFLERQNARVALKMASREVYRDEAQENELTIKFIAKRQP